MRLAADVTREVFNLVGMLDGLNRYRYRRNPELLAEWELATHVRAAPRRHWLGQRAGCVHVRAHVPNLGTPPAEGWEQVCWVGGPTAPPAKAGNGHHGLNGIRPPTRAGREVGFPQWGGSRRQT